METPNNGESNGKKWNMTWKLDYTVLFLEVPIIRIRVVLGSPYLGKLPYKGCIWFRDIVRRIKSKRRWKMRSWADNYQRHCPKICVLCRFRARRMDLNMIFVITEAPTFQS